MQYLNYYQPTDSERNGPTMEDTLKKPCSALLACALALSLAGIAPATAHAEGGGRTAPIDVSLDDSAVAENISTPPHRISTFPNTMRTPIL